MIFFVKDCKAKIPELEKVTIETLTRTLPAIDYFFQAGNIVLFIFAVEILQ